MNYLIYLSTLLTIFVFWIAFSINRRWKSLVFNTFVLTVLLLVLLLLATGLPYDKYMEGNAPLNNLLGVSIVALALPLYEQFRQIRARWKSILLIIICASSLSMLTGTVLAILLGATPEMVATVMPKSVTTPIAMAIAENLHGVPSIAAVGVVLAGLQGSVFGYLVLKFLGIKNSEAIGLAIGSMSHALGTVSCMEVDKKAGSYSSIALVLCGIFSSILAPLMFKLIYAAIA